MSNLPLDDVLTPDAIAALLETAEMRLLHKGDVLVMAERPIVGVRHVLRRIVVRRESPTEWRAVHLIRSGYEHEVTHSAVCGTVTDLGLLIGGWLSIPYARAEVVALCDNDLVRQDALAAEQRRREEVAR